MTASIVYDVGDIDLQFRVDGSKGSDRTSQGQFWIVMYVYLLWLIDTISTLLTRLS